MKPRHKRAAMIVGGLAALGLAAYFVLNAFESNLVFFFSPTQVAAGEAPKNRTFRIGGLVKLGSVSRRSRRTPFGAFTPRRPSQPGPAVREGRD